MPVQPLLISWAAGASWIAQGFSGDVKQLTDLIIDGIKHPGFGLLNVFSPCVVFNRAFGYEFYREHVTVIPRPAADAAEFFRWVAENQFATGVLWRLTRPVAPSMQIQSPPATSQFFRGVL